MALIEIRNLVKKFDEKVILSKINLDINEGDIKVIMGPSGCGKTTLIMCLNRLVEPTSGSIRFHGQDITKSNVDIRALRKRIGFVFQSFALYRHLTVLDNVTLALRKLNGLSRVDANERAMHELARLEMAAHFDKYPAQISGGQKQRVALARALVMDPEVLIFDEPTSALDPVMTREVAALITKLHNEKVTIVCVTHDVSMAEQISDTAIFMEQGIVKAEGNIDLIFRTHPDLTMRDFFGQVNRA
ncbi:amino acid ABC transporter ATP-binding protein [Pseudomonas koreensis]|uniref:amino acid ABC transporter ATP-binding protein n=1 Tax=Pseudomonas koreensis TaxID=198620 RepID=UPI00320BAACA